jgi:hypothetical protein
MTSSAARPPTLPARSLAIAAQGLILLVVWLLVHAYLGITHDATIYSMQALAHLRPDLWAGDIYLRYGSQDQYTLFPRLYALAIGSLGLDRAAAVLTLLSQAAFFAVAWLFARRIAPPRIAALALLLLLITPGAYGAQGIFHIAEDFATPRLAAEALVLASLLAMLDGRRGLAMALCAAAALLHPLMAMAGIVVMLWLWIGMPRPRLAIGLATLGLAALLVFGMFARGTALYYDDEWHAMLVAHASYLFLERWSVAEWTTAALPLCTLAIAAKITPAGRLRNLMLAALGTELCGLLLAMIGGDWLRLTCVVQGQAWRWIWLGAVLATMILPSLTQSLWHRGLRGRVTLGLLFSAYLVQGEELLPLILLAAATANATFDYGTDHLSARSRYALNTGLALLLGICLASNIGDTLVSVRATEDLAGNALAAVRQLLHSESAALALCLAIYYCGSKWRSSAVFLCSVIVAASSVTALLLPGSAAAWTSAAYPQEIFDAFAPWRAHIPPGAEVLNLSDPLGEWMTLQRPNYLSRFQAISAVFSRSAAMALKQRSDELSAYLAAEHTTILNKAQPEPIEPISLADLCAASRVRYVATHQDLHAPWLGLPAAIRPPYRGLRLYSCASPVPW